MNGSFDVSTVVFALLAIFVVWKLRSVLGTRTGNERPPTNPFARRNPADAANAAPDRGNVVSLPGAADHGVMSSPRVDDPDRWKGFATAGSPVAIGLDQIVKADPDFAVAPFIDGARAAYEAIILAFAKGDRQTLQPLLAKDVYDGFNTAITAREQRGEIVETTFVSLATPKIDDVQLRGKTAQISVQFAAQSISITKGSDGKEIEGSSDTVADMLDLWTFAREIGSRDPNWKLVATETGR
ncbi:Tim44/TimA family putative adaptor protein [Lichenihabitans sp. PAMC28606]|uniref:Tim44/TimA family putative adaptor protein n=1 Tax=Lichenihabitans sp. PAMC28606 TaxID=2880932 RepID=UPI001D0A80B3|nr:Tim44/TimA family putative adaptor protein [Lichenihabitans sp. PAMC28606]UDL95861.1 Tim44/TimA family putative adaptor protein [Lichenihabitans sp. PAMC28606]